MAPLPDPPDSLAPTARCFYDELRSMLDFVQPRELDLTRATVEFSKRGVDVKLPHRSHKDWAIYAWVAPSEAIVGVHTTHEHFNSDDEGRPWPVIAVDCIAEILRGEIEIETDYRGDTEIRVSSYLVDPSGARQALGTTGAIRPAALMFWKPTRTEIVRVTFGATPRL